MSFLGIGNEDWDVFWKVIQAYPVQGTYLVFGSRSKGHFKPYADLDICLKVNHPLEPGVKYQIQEDLKESSFPYIVDFCLYHELSQSFQKIIDHDGIEISPFSHKNIS